MKNSLFSFKETALLITTIAVVLVSVSVAISYGQINSMREPVAYASGSVDSLMVTATSPAYLPTSIVAFTGSGDEFFVNFWGDWDDNGTFEWSSVPVAVPGAMTLRRISGAQYRSGDALWRTGWAFNCATDSVCVISGDK